MTVDTNYIVIKCQWRHSKLSSCELFGLGAVGYFYWQKLHAPSLEERYKTQILETGDVTQTVSANGTLNPVVPVNVDTQVSGTVKKLYVDFNDKIEQGQVLMELDQAV